MNDKKYLEITDENDEIIKYEILLAFKIENEDNYYVVYTDNIPNEDGSINIYAANYDPFDNTKFNIIKNENIWKIIKSKINELMPQNKLNLKK